LADCWNGLTSLLLADLFATLLGDCIAFGEQALDKTLDVGPHATLIVLTVASSDAKREKMKVVAERVDEIRGGFANGNAAIGKIVLDVYPEARLLGKVRALVKEARDQG
jgi:hypothetical protein